jgi:hypothetical protein
MLLILLFACEDQDKVYEGPSGSGIDIFCDDFSEAGMSNEYEFDSATSGRLEAQLIVDEDNPRDTSLIGNATYTMENLVVGGGEQLDQANPLGALSKTLGEGEWNLRIEGADGCSNEITVDIQAGVLLEMCIPLYCLEE